jgi:hypothetical protein
MKFLFGVLLFSALPALAAEPFTGTWKIDVASAKFSQKPAKYELANGTYKCLTCDPPVTVKADGKDQAVSGHPSYDTMSVRIIDDHSIELIEKKAGKIVSKVRISVSSDGATAAEEFTAFPESSAKPVTGAATLKRVGKSVAGMHAASGSWLTEKAENVSENALLATFEQTAENLRMTMPTGEHYDAKLDGKPYPYAGSPDVDHVMLKRIGARGVEETDKRGEKVISTTQMTVSPDGRSMTMVVHEPARGVSTYVFQKQ